MFPINDALDAILVGTFLFGLLFTVGSFLLGIADLGADANHDHGLDNLFNLSSILAFITWFGGVGYLARTGFGWPWPVAMVMALAGGLFAAWLAFQFMRRILKSPDQFLNPEDYERVGVLARVTSGIRAGGVGEIVWEQGGSRSSRPPPALSITNPLPGALKCSCSRWSAEWPSLSHSSSNMSACLGTPREEELVAPRLR